MLRALPLAMVLGLRPLLLEKPEDGSILDGSKYANR